MEYVIGSCLALGHTCSLFRMTATERGRPSLVSPLHGYTSILHIHRRAMASLGGGQQCVSFAYESTVCIRAERMITPLLQLRQRGGVVASVKPQHLAFLFVQLDLGGLSCSVFFKTFVFVALLYYVYLCKECFIPIKR